MRHTLRLFEKESEPLACLKPRSDFIISVMGHSNGHLKCAWITNKNMSESWLILRPFLSVLPHNQKNQKAVATLSFLGPQLNFFFAPRNNNRREDRPLGDRCRRRHLVCLLPDEAQGPPLPLALSHKTFLFARLFPFFGRG